jgi:cytochrome b6-f complex iron-sulfur subunit
VDGEKKQPSDMDKSRLSRRGFFGWLMSLSITATLASVLTAVIGCSIQPRLQAKIKMPPTLVGILGDFPPNMGKVVTVGGRSIIVTNTQAAGLKAFTAICTHEGCVVEWNKWGGYIQCPCHEGSYNPQTGAVISGPPPFPLRSYELAIQGEEVYVGRPLG